MTLKSKVLDHLFFLIMGMVYTYALSKSIITSTVLSVPGETIFLLSISCVIILYIYFFNKYTRIFFTALILFVALFIYMTLASNGFKSDWYVELSKFLYEVYWFVRGYFPHMESYNLTLTIFTVSAIAIVTVICIKLRFGFYILAVFGGCIIMIPVVMNYYRTDEASLIFSFCFLVFFAKKLNLSAKSPEFRRNEGFSFALIPVCACLVLFASILPAPGVRSFAPNQALSSNVGMEAVNDFFYVAFNPKYFSFQTSGFTGREGRLGGRVTANGRFVMEVYSDERVYLSGAIRDQYTGWSWKNTKTVTEAIKEYEDISFDLTYGSNALYDIVGDNKQVRINVGGSRTQTVFSPPNTRDIIFDSNVMLYKNEAGDLSLEKLLGKDSGYTINYSYINSENLSSESLEDDVSRSFEVLGSEFFPPNFELPTTLPKSSLEMLLENDSGFAINYGYINSEDLSSESLEDDVSRSFEVLDSELFSANLDLPTTLPKRVYDLANDITANEESDYQKMKALEGYLRGFSYTLEPADMPVGEDFVDHFLFEGKEGYCTYYASALAVMGRCVGIPTRYLEGYIMPPQKNSNGAYEVTSYQAHAWVEGYIMGLGWVAFEPTAPFAYSLDSGQSTIPREVFSNSMYENESNYYEYMMEMGFSGQSSNLNPTPVKVLSADENFDNMVEFVITLTLAVLSFALTLFAIFGISVLIRYLKFSKIEKMSNKDAVIAYFAHILKVAKVYTYPIMKNETAFAYASRVGRRFAFENEMIYMIDLARIFSKASYGYEDVSDEEKRRMRDCYFEFLNMLRRYRLFKIQFIFYKYVISII